MMVGWMDDAIFVLSNTISVISGSIQAVCNVTSFTVRKISASCGS